MYLLLSGWVEKRDKYHYLVMGWSIVTLVTMITEERIGWKAGIMLIYIRVKSAKELVHLLIKRVTIQHNYNNNFKSGYFLIKIEYSWLEESTMFMTDWTASKWYQVGYCWLWSIIKRRFAGRGSCIRLNVFHCHQEKAGDFVISDQSRIFPKTMENSGKLNYLNTCTYAIYLGRYFGSPVSR